MLYTHNRRQSFRQLQAFTMYTNIERIVQFMSIPCFLFPFSLSLLLPFVSLYFPLLTWNPPCCDRICPPQSQVARKLISPFPHSTPYTPHSKIPTPWGFPELNIHFTKTTSQTWVTRSSTLLDPRKARSKGGAAVYVVLCRSSDTRFLRGD